MTTTEHFNTDKDCAIDQDTLSHCKWAFVVIHNAPAIVIAYLTMLAMKATNFKGRMILKTGRTKIRKVAIFRALQKLQGL